MTAVDTSFCDFTEATLKGSELLSVWLASSLRVAHATLAMGGVSSYHSSYAHNFKFLDLSTRVLLHA